MPANLSYEALKKEIYFSALNIGKRPLHFEGLIISEPQTLYTQDPSIDNSCEESDASSNERNFLIFFTFLYMVRTVSLVNHRQTSFLTPLRAQALLKFPALCCFLSRKYHQAFLKKPFCCNSDKFSFSSSILNTAQHRWSQLFPTFAPATRANILTFVQDFFVFKQPIEPMSPEPFDSRAKAPPAKR